MIKSQCTGFLNTPPLWEQKHLDIQQFEFPILDLSSFEPKALPGNIRLGHQMEYVFKQLVEYSANYDVVLYNLPIRQEKNTLGEIDFILKDNRSQKLVHVEMTYKFYIIDPEMPGLDNQIIGPNRRDSFFLKTGKIKNKQFPLLHTPEGAKALMDNDIDHLGVEHQCCFKGQLFQPYGSKDVNIGALNKACLVGCWLRFDNFKGSTFTSAQYYMPTKSEWVIEPHNEVAWKSHVEIINDIEPRMLLESAPMIWLKKSNTQFEKLFVVWW